MQSISNGAAFALKRIISSSVGVAGSLGGDGVFIRVKELAEECRDDNPMRAWHLDCAAEEIKQAIASEHAPVISHVLLPNGAQTRADDEWWTGACWASIGSSRMGLFRVDETKSVNAVVRRRVLNP